MLRDVLDHLLCSDVTASPRRELASWLQRASVEMGQFPSPAFRTIARG